MASTPLAIDIASTSLPSAKVSNVQELTADNLAAEWEHLLGNLGGLRGEQLRLAGLPAIIGPKTLVIRFPDCYTAAYDVCREESCLEQIRASLMQRTGSEWQVCVELLPSSAAGPVQPRRLSTQELLQLPLFRTAAEKLGAELIQLDPGFFPGTAHRGFSPASADPRDDEED